MEKNSHDERRQHIRIKKNYILRFSPKGNPSVKFEVSQVENVSKGGLCFTSTVMFDAGEEVSIELKTPFITDTLYLEGCILECIEKIPGLIYQNRLRFNMPLSGQAEDVLSKIEEYNSNAGGQ